MKIRIMTFNPSVNNYGQIMQCFALQKYLRDKGHDVKVIKYRDAKNSLWIKTEHANKSKIYFGGLYKREGENADETLRGKDEIRRAGIEKIIAPIIKNFPSFSAGNFFA